MAKKFMFKFYATVSDRGQIFIPKVIQDYCGIRNRDKVAFVVQADGNVVFGKRKEKDYGKESERS